MLVTAVTSVYHGNRGIVRCETGGTVFFVPRDPVARGRNPVAGAVLVEGAQLEARIEHVDERGFGFAQLGDTNGTQQLLLVDLTGYALGGHVHPGIVLRGAFDDSARLPCFVLGPRRAILPAFGGFTGLAMVTPARENGQIDPTVAAVCALLDVHVSVAGTRLDERPLLIVSNHVSWLDISVITSVAPVVFVAKREVGAWPFGWVPWIGWLAPQIWPIGYNLGESIGQSIVFNIANWLDGNISFGQGLINVGQDHVATFAQQAFGGRLDGLLQAPGEGLARQARRDRRPFPGQDRKSVV